MNHKSNNQVTIETIEKYINSFYCKSRHCSIEIIYDYYNSENIEEKNIAENYIKLLNRVVDHVENFQNLKNIPYIEYGALHSYLFDQEEFFANFEEFFPLPVYISANADEHGYHNPIGIMIDKNNNILEIHEGNDEATFETIALANSLLNPSPKLIKIYAAHNATLVYKIDSTEILPQNLFVSPKLNVAQAYANDLYDHRIIFTGLINSNDINQVSDIDWVTIKPTKIFKFKLL